MVPTAAGFFLVIVAYLHYLVIRLEQVTSTTEANISRVDRFLKQEIQIGCSYYTTLHGCQNLDVAAGNMIVLWKPVLYKLYDSGSSFIRILSRYIEKVGGFPVAQIWHQAFVDLVCVHYDATGLCLSENAGKSHDRETL